MSIFWVCIFLSGRTDSFSNYLFSVLMCGMPLLGGVFIIAKSNQWKGEGGLIHKGLFFTGIGLILWGLGCVIWSYYNFVLKVSAPYPSLADLGYAPSVFFYCVGASYLARGAGADLGSRRKYAKFIIVFVPMIVLAFSYYLLVDVARAGILFVQGDPILKTLTDLSYPIGDAISLTVSIVLSGLYFDFLCKRYKYGIISVLSGLGVMFFADFVFSYTTTRSTYYNADFGDFLFVIGMFLLAFGSMFFLGGANNSEFKNNSVSIEG